MKSNANEQPSSAILPEQGDGAPASDLANLPIEELEQLMSDLREGTQRFKEVTREHARRIREEKNIPDDVVRMYDFEKPDPMDWTVAGIVPEGHLTMLIGDGGTGKSFLALHMAMCIAAGRPFLRRGVKRGNVLYVDHELDEAEQKRRTYRVAEGMGLSVSSEALRQSLYYLRPDHSLGTAEHQGAIIDAVHLLNIDVIVLDSLTMGAAADVKDEADVVPIMQQIRQWPTTVGIDHVSHSTARNGRAADARAYGSVFKRNAARSSLTLAKADTGGYALQQEKSNFDAGDARLCYATEFTDDAVRFECIDEADERAAGLLSEMSTKDQTLAAVKDEFEALNEAVLAENVVQWREERDECKDVSAGTVRNHFTALQRRGDLKSVQGEGVRPTKAEYEPA
jgi:KaiC/GvpD/RAD55 family RecA-like ATPase